MRVYPRVRGGTMPLIAPRSDPPGLSPRARGNHDLRLFNRLQIGSIPACAGEPTGGGISGIASQVYPRVRGGTRPLPLPVPVRSGLSPRARGNR